MDELVESLTRRLPPAPYELRSSFRDTAPWLAGLSAVLDLLIGGRGSLLISIVGDVIAGYGLAVFGLVLLLPAILCVASIPGLRAQRASGWWLFFAALLIDLLLALAQINLFSIIFTGVFLYLMLQIHEYYWQRPRLYR